MPLFTTEERFAQLTRRVCQLELDLRRLRDYAEQSERLSDNVHHRLAGLIRELRSQTP